MKSAREHFMRKAPENPAGVLRELAAWTWRTIDEAKAAGATEVAPVHATPPFRPSLIAASIECVLGERDAAKAPASFAAALRAMADELATWPESALRNKLVMDLRQTAHRVEVLIEKL